MMANRRLEFLFDYISPNAYIAWKRVGDLAARHRLSLDPRPVLFAGILGAIGSLGPAEIPSKRRWMWRNVARKCARLGLPLRPPHSHPFNPLLALRVSSAPMDGDARGRLIDGLFDAVWAAGKDVSDPAVVAAVASAAGLDGDAAVAEAATAPAKQRLLDETAAAIAAGAFGVPTLLLEGELFWGYDDFEWLERRLRGEDRFDDELVRAWEAVPASARRRTAR
jgi:2-hydroxychromene-2-carboxylate isomerase